MGVGFLRIADDWQSIPLPYTTVQNPTLRISAEFPRYATAEEITRILRPHMGLLHWHPSATLPVLPLTNRYPTAVFLLGLYIPTLTIITISCHMHSSGSR